ncbi:MAG: hypothetical protein TUN42_07400 [Dehalogenimonas sp.]
MKREPLALQPVGHLDLGGGPGNITDLWAFTAAGGRSYAYLGTYDQPECPRPDTSGVHVVDITDPTQPVKAGRIPAPAGLLVSDVGLFRVNNAFFHGDLLVFSVEICHALREQQPRVPVPGIVIYDVTDPRVPRRLAENFSLNFEAHNALIYESRGGIFVSIVEDDSIRDFHIIEITNPNNPVERSASGAVDWAGLGDQREIGFSAASFVHDTWVQSYPSDNRVTAYAGKTIAYLSYWDAGMVILDITDPAKPIFMGDSDYRGPDPVTGRPPEGNSHSAVPTADGRYVFMGDEDVSAIQPGNSFDGWGYGRIFDVADPSNIIEISQVTVSNTLSDPPPPGYHSIHNLLIVGNRAYIAWYADGIRVVDFSNPAKPRDIAAFVDTTKGSDFWGVFYFKHPNGKNYILGSDRSTGLWIFEDP